jgi:hypothetical protein
MSLSMRKLLLISVVVTVIVLANAWGIADWLDQRGLIGWAQDVRTDYLTGTAVTIVVVLLFLLPSVRSCMTSWTSSRSYCPVCDAPLRTGGRYCPVCGSRIAQN